MAKMVHSSRLTLMVILLASLLLTPILIIIASLFTPHSSGFIHIVQTTLSTYISNSIILVLGVGLLSTSIGIVTAYLVTFYDFMGRSWLRIALIFPIATPAYIVAYLYAGLLDYAGPVQTQFRIWFGNEMDFFEIRSLTGAIIILSMTLFPYPYLFAISAFKQQGEAMNVAKLLGKSSIASFFKLAIPGARPHIVAGSTLVMMEVLADFGTVKHFAVDTFTTGIYRSWFNMHDPNAAMKLSAFLLITTLALFSLERIIRGKRQYAEAKSFETEIHPIPLGYSGSLIAFLCCIIPCIIGFMIPLGVMLYNSIYYSNIFIDNAILPVLLQSITVAILGSFITLIIGIFFAYSYHSKSIVGLRSLIRLTTMGYAIPGSVIAVGILIFLGAIDRWFHLFLTGTIITLLIAYSFRFLALSFHNIEAGLHKITAEMNAASRVMGNSGYKHITQILLPMIQPSLLAASILVFVEILKELPATLILRPFNFETLATKTYQLASDERLVDASSYGIMIVAVGLIPVILLSTMMFKNRAIHG